MVSWPSPAGNRSTTTLLSSPCPAWACILYSVHTGVAALASPRPPAEVSVFIPAGQGQCAAWNSQLTRRIICLRMQPILLLKFHPGERRRRLPAAFDDLSLCRRGQDTQVATKTPCSSSAVSFTDGEVSRVKPERGVVARAFVEPSPSPLGVGNMAGLRGSRPELAESSPSTCSVAARFGRGSARRYGLLECMRCHSRKQNATNIFGFVVDIRLVVTTLSCGHAESMSIEI